MQLRQDDEDSHQTLSAMVPSGPRRVGGSYMARAKATKGRASVGDGGTARRNPQDERVSGDLKGVLTRLLRLEQEELFRQIVGFL